VPLEQSTTTSRSIPSATCAAAPSNRLTVTGALSSTSRPRGRGRRPACRRP
jgi:hypothetical protein